MISKFKLLEKDALLNWGNKNVDKHFFPYYDIKNINSLNNNFQEENVLFRPLFFEIREIENNLLIANLRMYSVEAEFIRFLTCGGRFGYLSVDIFSNSHISITQILNLIDSYAKEKKYHSISIALPSQISYENNLNNWVVRDVTFYIADINKSCDPSGLIFKKAKTRSGLSRSLKAAKKQNIQICFTKNMSKVSEWYKNCHQKRIEELNGKVWDFKFFENFINFGTGCLAYAFFENTQSIIGGCFFLESTDMYELFMMSTAQEFQKYGVNHLLAEKIYLYAFSKNVRFVNWQASNPPNSPLVNFKKSWNCESRNFYLFNKKYKEIIFPKPNNLLSEFYIYPY